MTPTPCQTGPATVVITDEATGDELASYSVQVQQTQTDTASLSPASSTLTVGEAESFTLDTNVAADPRV